MTDRSLSLRPSLRLVACGLFPRWALWQVAIRLTAHESSRYRSRRYATGEGLVANFDGQHIAFPVRTKVALAAPNRSWRRSMTAACRAGLCLAASGILHVRALKVQQATLARLEHQWHQGTYAQGASQILCLRATFGVGSDRGEQGIRQRVSSATGRAPGAQQQGPVRLSTVCAAETRRESGA